MAGPWEQFAATSTPGPWEDFAPQRGAMDKLTGEGGDRYQTWPERLARSLAASFGSAVTLPHDVMTGESRVPSSDGSIPGSTTYGAPDSAGTRIADLATLGTPLAPKVASSLAKTAIPTAQELKSAAQSGYDTARNLGVEVQPAAVSNLGEKIGASLNEAGIDATLAPKTFTIISKLGNPPAGSVATISNFETLRRTLGHAAKDFTNPTEQLAARRAIEHLDDYLATLPASDVIRGSAPEAAQILKNARGNYAAARRSEQITAAVDAADLNAAAANSGQNIGNANRQRIKSILTSDKKSSGYSPKELAQMERVVGGTTTGNALRFGGNLLGGGGGLGAVVSASAGAAINPALAALPVVGYGMKKLSDASVNRQIKLLDEMVRLRAPAADGAPRVMTPAEKFKEQMILRSIIAGQSRSAD